MKNLTKSLFATAAIAQALASCNKLPSAGVSNNEIRFENTGIGVETKAFYEVTDEDIEINGFNIAAIVDNGNGVMFNKAVTYNKDSYTVPGEHYYWPVSGTMSFYGVYPKTQAIGISSGVATLSYTQNSDTDLIAAKATGVSKTSSAVALNFDHILSQVSIKVQGKETTVDYKVFSVTLTAPDGGTYAYSNGTWTPSSTTADYSVYSNGSGIPVVTDAMTALGSPMSFVPGKAKLNVVWKCYNKTGTKDLVCAKDVTVDVTLTKGKNTTFNLTLSFSASGLTFNSSVGEWVSEEQSISILELVPGLFTVSDSGKKVKFVKGNLYWNGNSFCCEDQQYDYPAVWNANHVGHFYWSRDARVAYSGSYNTANTTYGITPATTDKFFAADDGVFEGYTVLSKDEWQYLLEHALEKNEYSNTKFRTIDGKRCAVLNPDGFSGTVADSYTAAEWAIAESTYGLVALPFAGYRYRVDLEDIDISCGFWSSTPNDGVAGNAWNAHAMKGGEPKTLDKNRDNGRSVRLVQVQ